jgi:hypothetical protein
MNKNTTLIFFLGILMPFQVLFAQDDRPATTIWDNKKQAELERIVFSEQAIPRKWAELMILSLREDFARPPVNARTLMHVSTAMYDAWAAFDAEARPFVLGNTINGTQYPFTGIPAPANLEAARNEAISYAAYRMLRHRFQFSPNVLTTNFRYNFLMSQLGYDINNASTDYTSGSPAALGNKIAEYIIHMGQNDNSNEASLYAIQNYVSTNLPLDMGLPGNPDMIDPNHWQPLKVTGAVDQNGNPIPALQKFQMPEWGRVLPFAMDSTDRTVYYRGNWPYPVYHDPGPPPYLNNNGVRDSIEDLFDWGNAMVSVWGSHHDPNDGVMWDISPATIGNVQDYPENTDDYAAFYNFEEGGDNGIGHDINPKTGQPYTPNMVPRGDYTRVISQFWADGPNSETPPGHWYVILNYAMDQPGFIRRFNGKGPELDNTEWEVKMYFALGGALHDAAIGSWGVKGWYDAGRPVSLLRYMGTKGQHSDPNLPSFSDLGLELRPGFIELVQAGDPLAGLNNENVGRVKVYTWKGHNVIVDPMTDVAGAGWKLAELFTTYQKKTFVSPPFAGYISGHSTYSRAAADMITAMTGDPYFPGGMGVFPIAANSNFLVFERGPSVDVNLQWATYRDAADQTSLSRIWGGIHAPYDDYPGRVIGGKCADKAFQLARTYFYNDKDGDGFFSYEDCNDDNSAIYPGAIEVVDNIDNNCDGIVDNLSSTGEATLVPEFTCSPNPVTDELLLQFEQGRHMAVTVTDVAGKVLRQFDIAPAQTQYRMDCRQWAMGAYFIRLTDLQTGAGSTKQFVKWIR